MTDPLWQQNLRDALLLDPLVLVHGNVKDLFRVSPDGAKKLPPWLTEQPYVSFDLWLALELERQGFPIVVLYDAADGACLLRGAMVQPFTALASEPPRQGATAAPKVSDVTAPPKQAPALPTSTASNAVAADGWLPRLEVRQKPNDFFRTLYSNVLPRSEPAVAVVCRFTDRYLSYSDRQSESERELSLLIQKAALAIPSAAGTGLRSRISLVFDVEGAVPQELSVYAPFAHSARIPAPTLEERERFFADNHGYFHSEPNDRFDPTADNLRLLANLSDGLKTQDLLSLIALSRREKLGLGRKQVRPLLDRFRFGTHENAWLKIKDDTLRQAKETLKLRVKGQDEVIDEVVPTLIRAKLGMSDIGAAEHSRKPRGIFFFVGPTGVGKTELSKAIAELVFGDENTMLRFDMSEYSEEHQQARLIGAPPGYVGFDQGGQLTNAILEKPFSVVLFDEIEKAHGRILDKFLQILDDGRLTDGMGRTVYFSEAILIFTSNIGTSPRGGAARRRTTVGAAAVDPAQVAHDTGDLYERLGELDYERLSEHFRQQVKDFFVNELGRPEILNRIGEDNILVFRFLNDKNAQNEIVVQQIDKLNDYLREKYRVGVYCTDRFRRLLIAHPSGFARNGARGVRNLLKRYVLNPLAEDLFQDRGLRQGKTFRADYRVKFEEIGESPFAKGALTYDWYADDA